MYVDSSDPIRLLDTQEIDGTAEIRSSSADLGQGLQTVLAQFVAEELGLPYHRVRVLLSDTDRCPDGGPTTASRQTYVTGNAARLAARAMRQRLSAVVAERCDVPPDEIVFADEYGTWMIPIDERKVIPEYLAALSSTTTPEAYAAAALPLIRRDSFESFTNKTYAAALRAADKSQKVHLKAEVKRLQIRTSPRTRK